MLREIFSEKFSCQKVPMKMVRMSLAALGVSGLTEEEEEAEEMRRVKSFAAFQFS